MKTLMLLRHAKSSWTDPAQDDHDRPLNKRGQRSADALGDWLRANTALPQETLCSTAERTVETWERLKIDAPISFHRRLYHAAPETMLTHLAEATADRVMMIGHNPGIGALADQLTATPPNHPRFWDYPTAALLILHFQIESWADMPTREGQLETFLIPADLGVT